MVRQLKKPSRGPEALKELELVTDKEVNAIHAQRARDFKDELDLGFYFSVVFDNRRERDKWLKDHGLKLVEDFFIKAGDFKV
ncbi:MAG: hypothetical protein LBQ88_01680 [Treponema sp.]|jgi:hypothetical protein|nr:hypothetical protein [Treponema sp.]